LVILEKVRACAISHDDSFIVLASDNTLYLWGVNTKKTLKLQGHKSRVWSFAISRESSFIVSTSSDKVCVWDTQSGSELRNFEGHSACLWQGQWQAQNEYYHFNVRACAISHDTSFIITGSDDKKLCMRDTITGKLIHQLKGHTNRVRTCAVSLDGSFIISGAADETVCVWDTKTGKLINAWNHRSKVRCGQLQL